MGFLAAGTRAVVFAMVQGCCGDRSLLARCSLSRFRFVSSARDEAPVVFVVFVCKPFVLSRGLSVMVRTCFGDLLWFLSWVSVLCFVEVLTLVLAGQSVDRLSRFSPEYANV